MSEGPAPDFGAILSQLGQVQQQLQSAQESAAAAVVVGSAGGGAVRIEATGGLDFREVRIDRDMIDPADVDLLADLVLAAIRDTVEQANRLQADALGGLGIGGLGMGGLGGGGIEGLLGQ